ncbi:MAG: AAC(3) family N-acetyltransferase [Alphaproteobacteria bacterium]|nr:AAC(3) family N-acetyltransferase [Alphaproteobacteria bacterium]
MSTIDMASLQRDLAALGVRGGDVAMVHVSLRKMGLARGEFGTGGAELLLKALEAAVGPDGTLLMILGSDYAYDWVNAKPVADRARLLAGTPPYDARTAAVLPEVGWFAEVFRRASGTLLSDNPSGRFAARGRRAEELLRDQPWNDYYGPGSPLQKLCDASGKVLRLGADPETVTVLHYAEYLARVPGKRRTRWDYVVGGEGGPRHTFIECLDDAHGIVDWPGEDYFALVTKAYLATGAARQGVVGRAASELINAAAFAAFGAAWMEKNFG